MYIGLPRLAWRDRQLPARLGRASVGTVHRDGGSVDAIIHNGARVHWNDPYSVLRAQNALSTLDILAAAAHSSNRFGYISGGVHTPRPPPALPHRFLEALPATNGYTQSKTLPEQLIRDYASRMHGSNHYMSIITPGYTIGDADAGDVSLDDFLWRYTSACVQLGSFNGSGRAHWLFVAGRQDRQFFDGRRWEHCITVAEFWCVIMETLQRDVQPLPPDGFMPLLRASVEQCARYIPCGQ